MNDGNFLTADLVDAYADRLRICDVQFRQFSRIRRFHGPVRTLRTFEDNALIKQALSAESRGGVLVIDGGGSLHCALVGDVIAGLGDRNGWAGVIVYGAVRDTAALGQLGLGIKALGSNPRKSGKAGVGQLDGPVSFGGIEFRTGDWLYSDEDGIVVSDQPLQTA